MAWLERRTSPGQAATTVVGEWLTFNYPKGDRLKHIFYDSFPAGHKVRPAVAFVDLHAMIPVQEVRESMAHDGQVYAAVKFTTTNGTVVWTNVRRGSQIWMRISQQYASYIDGDG